MCIKQVHKIVNMMKLIMFSHARLLFFLSTLFTTLGISLPSHADLASHKNLAEGQLLGSFEKLDPNLAPGKNFDLLDWQLTLPISSKEGGRAQTVPEVALENGFSFKPVFYTADDGGMVFLAPNYGATTSKNTKYTRTELREMLRRGNTRIKTQGVNEKFSYKISVEKNTLIVTIIRKDKANITKTFDMSNSGYNKLSQWMYFKAGVYNQNNTGDKNDYVQATFYHIKNEHNGYKY